MIESDFLYVLDDGDSPQGHLTLYGCDCGLLATELVLTSLGRSRCLECKEVIQRFMFHRWLRAQSNVN